MSRPVRPAYTFLTMRLSAITFRIHRWLGWLVGVQVLLWVSGGVFFALVPFQAWVKGVDSVKPPAVLLPAGWAEYAAPGLQAAAAAGDVAAVAAVATPRGPALRLSYRGGMAPAIVPLDGSTWETPDAETVRRFGTSLYKERADLVAVERLATVPRRLGIVAETGGRGDLWRLRFDDALATRIYLDGRTGEFVVSRNDAWVWYDFFWRLHIMDYEGGEDFNGTLLRSASVVAWMLVIAGAVLAVLAARRSWRAARRPARS